MALSRTHPPVPPGRDRSAPAARPAPTARRPLILPLVIVVLGLGLGLAAWHTLGQTAARPSSPPAAGPVAAAIDAPTVDGGHFSLAAQRGKVVVLYAMAAWCTSCVPEASSLGQLAQSDQWRRGVATLLVDESPQSDTPAAVHAFRDRAQGPAQSWVLDQGGAIAQAYGVTALDTTVVIDRAGHIAARYSAPVDAVTLRTVVASLL